jgi:hypothetical protein
MTIVDLVSCVHLASFVVMLPNYLKYSTLSSCFLSIRICIGVGSLNILNISVFYTFISIPWRLPPSVSLCVIPSRNISSVVSSTRSYAYFTVRMISPIV